VRGRINICAQVVDALTIDLASATTPLALRTEPGVAQIIDRLQSVIQRILEENAMVREVQIVVDIDTEAEETA